VPQSLASVAVHLIFSTKDREGLILSEVEPRLHAFIIWVPGALPLAIITGPVRGETR
jgi:hypothetical protein